VLGIPKYLIRIGIVIVMISFGYMVYIMNNEEYSLEFLNASTLDHDFEGSTNVHPLFMFLQENYDPSMRFRQMQNGT